jgi:capsular exopolysaccharide synthesis family protein
MSSTDHPIEPKNLIAVAIDAAEDIRDPLEGIVEKTAADPGAAFAPEILERLMALKRDDRAAFEALRAQLKKAGCRVTALDEAIAEENGDTGGRGPKQGQVSNLVPFDSVAASKELASGADALDSLVGFVRRHVSLIVVMVLLANAVWALYVPFAPPSYTATAKVVVNSRSSAQPLPQHSTSNDAATETSDVQTAADILKSDEVARNVVTDLRLTDVAEFSGPSAFDVGRSSARYALTMLADQLAKLSSLDLPSSVKAAVTTVVSFCQPAARDSHTEGMRRSMKAFRNRLKVQPVASSHLIDVTFRSADAERAAKVANAVADALITIQLRANVDLAEKATAWSRARLQELQGRMEASQRALIQFRGAGNIGAHVALRDLTDRAQSYRKLYENSLQEEEQSLRRESFPIVQPSLIARALRPLEDSSSKGALAFTIVTLGGLMAGAGLGMLRDMRDRSFHTAREVEAALGLDCIAMVPTSRKLRSAWWVPGRRLFPRRIAGSGDPRFHESLRAIEFASGLSGLNRPNWSANSGKSRARPRGKVIGFTSALPNEGKSTLVSALAQHLMRRGGRVLLIDCDLRDPKLTRVLSGAAAGGLREVLEGAITIEQAILKGCLENLDFLPSRAVGAHADDNAVTSSKAMRDVFERVRTQYDAVFVDLPPLAPVVDARAVADLMDAYIFVVEWGCTSSDAVKHALRGANKMNQLLIGAVLNKVNFNRLGRYDRHLSRYYADDYLKR